eukprot:TRINITY_DN27442_c0_g1_i1.p1 TRINITY_DN27442_c0_g1~~TRINITY_DN27442_c0_g1_i1.p1  ORF type:complete len:2290 (+),score=499.19 TRINITY_DN27442_c0_g1_i1:44-6913(+)
MADALPQFSPGGACPRTMSADSQEGSEKSGSLRLSLLSMEDPDAAAAAFYLRSATKPVLGIDSQWNISVWNLEMAKVSGLSAEEVLGRSAVDTLSSSSGSSRPMCSKQQVSEALVAAFKSAGSPEAPEVGSEERYEGGISLDLDCKQGHRVSLQLVPCRSRKGFTLGLLGMGFEMPPSSFGEFAREISTFSCSVTAEQQTMPVCDLQELLDASSTPAFGTDLAGRVTEWNAALASLTGISREEACGRIFAKEFVPSSERGQVEDILSLAYIGVPSESVEVTFRGSSKSHRVCDVLLCASARRGSMGTITGAVGIAQDVTALKASAEISSNKADVLRQIVEETKVPVIGVDMQGSVNEWNGASAKLFGWGAGEVFGTPLIDILKSPKQDGNEVSDVFQEALKERTDVERQVSCLTKGGSHCNIMLNITPLRSGGKLTGAICFAYRVPEPQAAPAPMAQATTVSHKPEHAVESLAVIPEDSSSPASADLLPTATSRGSSAGMIPGRDIISGSESTVLTAVSQELAQLREQCLQAESRADDLHRLIDTATAPIFCVDQDARVTVWNKKVAELSGYPKAEAIGKALVPNFISEEYQSDVASVLLCALGGESVPDVELAFFSHALDYSEGNSRREVMMNVSPRIGPDGTVVGAIGVGHDITELRRLAVEHQREAEDMALLLRSAHAPILGVDLSGSLMEWNNKVASVTGYTKEEVLGRSLEEFLVDGVEAFAGMLRLAKEGWEDLGDIEILLAAKDGNQVILAMSGAAFHDTDCCVAGIIACGQDLTSVRRSIQEKTRVAEDLTRLIDTANAPIFGVDGSGNVTEWNRKVAQITGWNKQETLGKPFVETFINEGFREIVRDNMHRMLRGEEVANFEFPLSTKDGQQRDIFLSMTTSSGEKDEVVGVIGVGQDITDLRKAMAEQRGIADDLSRFIESANALIFGVSLDGRVMEWNRRAAELLGYTKEETVGRLLIEEFINPEFREAVRAVFDKAWNGEETVNFEFSCSTKDGNEIELLLNATPRKNASGQVTGAIGVGQDISALRKAYDASNQVAEDLTRLIDTANAPIFGVDVNGLVMEWNRKVATITGFSKQEALGKPMVETFITDSYQEEVGQVLQLALEGHPSGNFEFPLFTKDGGRRDILLNATTRRGREGTITGVIGVGQDITEFGELLRQSQLVADDLARLIETANAPIFGVDTSGCVTVWNRKAAVISGFPYEEAQSRPFVQDFISESHRVLVQNILDKALCGEEVANFELPLYSKYGEKREILLNATPRLGRDGDVIGVVGVGQDITEVSKQKQEALRVAAELRNIVDTASAPIIGIDRNEIVTEWNRRVTEVTGMTKEEAVGKELLSFVLDSCRAEVHRVIKEALAGKSTPGMEVMLVTKSQEPVVFLLSAAPRVGRDNRIVGVICVGQDITQMKEFEIKKSHVAATVTHELRSPLHGIIGLSDQLLKAGGHDATSKKSLTMINNCARRLLNLVTNIMDLSTLVRSKTFKLARDPVQIARLVEEVIVLTNMTVDKAGRAIQKPSVKLVNNVPENLPIIEADAHRCLQMLYNLVVNAFKYTIQGEVEVSAKADDAKQVLEISVKDTGIGIAPQNRDLIFRPFEQEDQSDGRRYEGLGLGLSLSREVAVKHGGDLTVESEVGHGSCFVVTLPYTRQFKNPELASMEWEDPEEVAGDGEGSSGEAEPLINEEQTPKSGLAAQVQDMPELKGRILVVDDDYEVREHIKRLLSRHPQVDATFCCSSHECKNLLETQTRTPPDLIITDVVMSLGAQGYQLIKWVRDKYPMTELPIIIVCAEKNHEIMYKVLRHGCNDFVAKPLKEQEFFFRIALTMKAKETYRISRSSAVAAHVGSSRNPAAQQIYEIHALDCYRLLCRILPGNSAEQIVQKKNVEPEHQASISLLAASLQGWEEVQLSIGADAATAALSGLLSALETISAPQGISVMLSPDGGMRMLALAGMDSQAGHERKLLAFAMELQEQVRKLRSSLKLPPAQADRLFASVGLDCGPVCRVVVGSLRPQVCVFGAPVMGARRLCIRAGRRAGATTLASQRLLQHIGIEQLHTARFWAVDDRGVPLRSLPPPPDPSSEEHEGLPSSSMCSYAVLRSRDVLPPLLPPTEQSDENLWQPTPIPERDRNEGGGTVTDNMRPRSMGDMPASSHLDDSALDDEPALPSTPLLRAKTLAGGYPSHDSTPSVSSRHDPSQGVTDLDGVSSFGLSGPRSAAVLARHLTLEVTQLRRHCVMLQQQCKQMAYQGGIARQQLAESERRAHTLELQLRYQKMVAVGGCPD